VIRVNCDLHPKVVAGLPSALKHGVQRSNEVEAGWRRDVVLEQPVGLPAQFRFRSSVPVGGVRLLKAIGGAGEFRAHFRGRRPGNRRAHRAGACSLWTSLRDGSTIRAVRGAARAGR